MDPKIWNPLSTVSPESVGLRWEECEFSQAGYHGNAAESLACYKRFRSESRNLEEQKNFGKPTDALAGSSSFYHTLNDGSQIYSTTHQSFLLLDRFELRRDQTVLSTQWAITELFPHQSLQKIGDRIVWEFSDPLFSKVIDDGTDLRMPYGLDQAYEPYGLNNRLIFVGKRGDRYQIIYDSQQVGPSFDEIVVAHCCELAARSVSVGGGQ
ncbi:MAG: hypothetical protein ACFCU8_09705 [Thermosynechococcaceae cyanobacterium]